VVEREPVKAGEVRVEEERVVDRVAG